MEKVRDLMPKLSSLFIGRKGRWAVYLLGVVCVFVALAQLAHFMDVYYVRSSEMQFRRLLDACLLSLPLLFLRKKGLVAGWMLLLGGYLLSVMWYYRTYATIMPLPSYLMFHNTDGLLSYIKGSMVLGDITILLPLLVFAVLYMFIQPLRTAAVSFRWLVSWICLLALLISLPYWPNKRPEYQQPLYLYGVVGARAFKEYGVVNFWVYQFSRLQSVSEVEKEFVRDYFAHQPMHRLKSLPVPSGHNLIVVLVESLQSWAVGLNHGGVEVTPVLNQLLRQDKTVYIPQMLSQVKDGRSSDAQLMINTGLLPLTTGAASSLCAENTFPSLADALHEKGYYAASFLCDDRDFWNQGRTTFAYGFDKLYDGLQQYAPKSQADSLLFEAALHQIPSLPQPFYAQLVTFSTHMPYDMVQNFSSLLLQQNFVSDEVRNYLVAVQLFDVRLGHFLDELKKQGLYDNSVIVIVGDHEQVTYNQYEGRTKVEVADNMIPFIVLNSPLFTQHTQQVFGQVDIYPSLLHLMGCADYRFTGLGESVFADTVSNVAVFRTEEIVKSLDCSISQEVVQHRKQLWKVSDILLRMNYFAE